MTVTYPYAQDGKLGISFTGILHPSTTLVPFTPDVTQIAVGTLATAGDGSVWVRVKWSTGGCTAAGYVCAIDAAYSAAVMMSNSVGALGDKVGVSANTDAAVSGDYGWLQVYGKCQQIRVAASCVANVALASTVTVGVIDDANGSGTKNISNIFITTTNGGAEAYQPGELNWPVIGSTN